MRRMKIKYIRFVVFATMLVASSSCANAGVAQQMQQQQYQQPAVPQPQYIPQDNDENYRLPGQYSPTLNDLRKQFPAQQVPAQPNPYINQYDQNDNTTTGHDSYYYQ